VRQSVVLIRVDREGQGSGVVWDTAGLVVTNAHVVRGDRLTVETSSGLSHEGKVVARDEGSDLALVPVFYALGVRVLGITHALRNYAADGAFFTPTRTGVVGGLSDFGAELVDRAQAMGMLLDVSHLNDPGVWDVIRFSRAPIIASHSNCRALTDHPRNLTDEQIKAVADSGGVIGINSIRRYVDPPDFPTCGPRGSPRQDRRRSTSGSA
jgi:membrane dipeptidase